MPSMGHKSPRSHNKATVYCFQTFLNSCIIDILAHNSSWFKIENCYQYYKCKHILVLARDIACTKYFNHSDNQAAQHGTGNVSDLTQNGSSKGFDTRNEPHVIPDRSIVKAIHDTGGSGKSRANGKGQGDDLIAADGHQS